MDPLITASLVSGAGGALTSIMGAKASNSAAKKQMAFQMMQQQMQQAWEKQKMLHAHQWEMQDLKNAGLNPALTAMGGSGASGGSIGMGQGAMPDTSGYAAGANAILNSVQTMINSAQTESRIKNETATTEAQIAKTMAETGKIGVESGLISKYGAKEIGARINSLNASSALNNAQQNQIGIKTGELAEEGINAIKHGIGNVGEFIADIISGGDKTKQTFQQRMRNAKKHSARNAKEAWQNIL